MARPPSPIHHPHTLATDRLVDKGLDGLNKSDPLLRTQLQPIRLNYDAFVQIAAKFCTYSRAEILQCRLGLCGHREPQLHPSRQLEPG
jgi:hypothetical protein